ncbi:NF038122 family metalloprotease [Bradyrhizobium sp. USDA 4353]
MTLLQSYPVEEDVGPPPSNPVELPEEAVEAQLAQGDFGGIGAATTISSGGLTINLLFDTAAMNAPASFRAGIQQAATILSSAISDHITVNIKIDYSGTGGHAAAGPDGGQWMAYSSIRSNLINNATPGDTTFTALPTGSSIQGQSYVAVWNSQLKLWGGLGANDTTTDDGSATFATDINPSLLVGVALHELTHAFGRVPYGPQPDIFDFYRFSSPGTRLMTGGATASTAYFSLDGGYTKLGDYGQSSDPSDFLNNGVQGGNDPFNEFYTYSTLQTLTTADLRQLDALGFHVTGATPTTIESAGATSLVQYGTSYYLYPVGGSSGPQLAMGGTPVIASQMGGWRPIGAERAGSGYQVVWQIPGTDQYTMWNADSNGNYISDPIGVVSGTSATLELLEAGLHQDFNGDGVIGINGTVIEAAGSTSLVQLGANYVVVPSGGSGAQLAMGGTPVIASQMGGWRPIGAENSGGGYQIVWHIPGTDQYTMWNADGHGNYVSDPIGVVSGTSTTLELLESSLHQDFNGDGVIGLNGTVIESAGATTLMQLGSNYLLSSGGAAGPQLAMGGTPVIASQMGGWRPIGAESNGGGYQVVWHIPGTDQYTMWNADGNGNYLSDPIGVVSGTSATLELLESSLHQDFNGDGVIGLNGTVIESAGSTTLMQFGANYLVSPAGSNSGPQLAMGGTPVIASQMGGWQPIGAESNGGGYQVVWHIPGTDRYTMWNADGNGNYLSDPIGVVSGTSATLELLESSLHQDFNGDGVIGINGTIIESVGATSLMQLGANYLVVPVGGTTGPVLAMGGSPVIASELGGWRPIGAESVSGGYQVAWRIPGTDQYTMWNADSNGNYISDPMGVVSGTSAALKSLETSLHQDLNGDGVIGASAALPASTQPSNAQSSTSSFGDAMRAMPHVLGSPTEDSFRFANEASAPNAAEPLLAGGAAPQWSTLNWHDAFVFAEHSGPVSQSEFTSDMLTSSRAVFADPVALQTGIQAILTGHPVVLDAANHAVAPQHLGVADFWHTSFHLV